MDARLRDAEQVAVVVTPMGRNITTDILIGIACGVAVFLIVLIGHVVIVPLEP